MHTLHYAPDNASLVVRIVLEELGVPYRTQLVDRAAREQESDAYRRLNPSGLIPVCVIDGVPVAETAAIILTLAERHGALAPAQGDPMRPKFLQWLFFLSNTLHADLRQVFYPDKYITGDLGALRDVARARVTRGFGILDAQLAEAQSAYLCGDTPSIADIYAAACLRWAQLYPVETQGQIVADGFPALKAMVMRLEQRPAIARACAAEGIATPFFSEPRHPNPPEGSAT